MFNAGDDFIDNVEENTNFVIPEGRNKSHRPRTGVKGGRETSTTILSQVKKYGVSSSRISEEQSTAHRAASNGFVHTRDGVTDDPENYRAPRAEYTYSHLNPPPLKKKEKSDKQSTVAKKIKHQVQKLYQGSKTELHVGELESPLSKKGLRESKERGYVASTSKLEERTSKNMKILQEDNKKSQFYDDDNKERDVATLTEKRQRDSTEELTMMGEDQTKIVSRQIQLKVANSSDYRLNDDSDDSVVNLGALVDGVKVDSKGLSTS